MKLIRVLSLTFLVQVITCNLSGGGFGAQYEWIGWESAKSAAQQQDKPIMLLLHKTWCGACKSLKPHFANSDELFQISKNFIMVNAEDDEAPSSDNSFTLDGGYIPRIIFLDSSGTIRPEYTNKVRGDRYKYFYPSADQIVATMKQVLDTINSPKQEL